MRTEPDKFCHFINFQEEAFSQTLNDLRMKKGESINDLFLREFVARILAATIPVFSLYTLTLKLAEGLFELGIGTVSSLRDGRRDISIFSEEHAKSYFEWVGKGALGVVGGTFVGIADPDTAQFFLEKRVIQPFTDEILKRTPQLVINDLYDELEVIDELFTKNSIDYCINGGTQLGATRHGGIIPWDDDGDIVILEKDEEQLLAMAKELDDKGFFLAKFWTGYKICKKSGEVQSQSRKNNPEVYDVNTNTWVKGDITFPFVDVMILKKEGEEYRLSDRFPEAKKCWPDERYSEEEWTSREKVDFGHLKLHGLPKANAKNYLEREYGTNWESEAYTMWDHRQERASKTIVVDIQDKTAAVKRDESCKIDHKSLAANAIESLSPSELDKNWQLDKFFGTIRVINLKKDSERLKTITDNLQQQVGLQPHCWTRFEAVNGRDESIVSEDVWKRIKSNYQGHPQYTKEGRDALKYQHQGQAGCWLSHYRAISETAKNYDDACIELERLKSEKASPEKIEEAKSRVLKHSSILILEDDNEFGRILAKDVTKTSYKAVFSDTLTAEGTGRIFYETMSDLPEDWEMFYLMAMHYEDPVDVEGANQIKRIKNASCMNCYAVSARMYPKILATLRKIDHPTMLIDAVDEEIAKLHETCNCYTPATALAAQDGRGSSINGVKSSPEDKEKRYWQCTTKKITKEEIDAAKKAGNDGELKRTGQDAVNKIYKTLAVLDHFLTKNGIKYCLNGGTQLGATRNRGEDPNGPGGLIPWDDDGDIAILERDFNAIYALKDQFEALGFELVEHKFCWKLQPKDGKPFAPEQESGKNGEVIRFPNVDIFLMKEREDGNYHIASEEGYNAWNYEYYTKEEWDSIGETGFGPLNLQGLRDNFAEAYLNRGYVDKVTKEPNWKNRAQRWWDHEEAKRDDVGTPNWSNIRSLELVELAHAKPEKEDFAQFFAALNDGGAT